MAKRDVVVMRDGMEQFPEATKALVKKALAVARMQGFKLDLN